MLLSIVFDELGGYSSLMTLRYYAVLLVPLLIPLSPLCADRRGLANKQHIASVQQKLEQLMNEDHVIGKKSVRKTTSDNKKLTQIFRGINRLFTVIESIIFPSVR
jgi:hypothetical protein